VPLVRGQIRVGVEIVESRSEEGRKGTSVPFLRDQLKCAFGLADSNEDRTH
jgi:hypothetical protein